MRKNWKAKRRIRRMRRNVKYRKPARRWVLDIPPEGQEAPSEASWSRLGDLVLVKCPNGHTNVLGANHVIMPWDGIVFPSIVCKVGVKDWRRDCWHVFGRLEGWDG